MYLACVYNKYYTTTTGILKKISIENTFHFVPVKESLKKINSLDIKKPTTSQWACALQ